MSYQSAPYLRFYTVLGIRIEEMQLKVLLQFLENEFYRPAVFVNQGNFFGPYLPVIGDKMIDSLFFVPVSYPAQARHKTVQTVFPAPG
jgi:hypothetical protein